MKLHAKHQAGFTMMEIAIAIGVIGFALIAIMGVLPTGMNIQRDNRQDTIINQDGAYILESMRNSARDIPDLHTFVEQFNYQPSPFTNSGELIRSLMAPDVGNSTPSSNLYLFRSITGPAVMRGVGVPTFQYLVRGFVTNSAVNPDLPYADMMRSNCYEVRLTFLWPVLANGQLATNAQKQVMRTVVSGKWDTNNNNFFTPLEFAP